MLYAVDIMKYIQPLVPLILGVVLMFLLIKQSVIRKKLLKGRLIFTFLIVLVCALVLAFYSELTNSEEKTQITQWCILGINGLIGILYILFCEMSSSREQFNKDLFLTLDHSKYYALVDSKNRIKEISSKFLEDLGLKDDDVYKKNLFQTIEKKYQIFKLNGTEVALEDLDIYFKSSDTKETVLNLELHDEHGDISAYYFTQRPILMMGRFRGRIFMGDKKDTEELVGMEKNLAESTDELNMIKSRFITLLEKTEEGIFFQDLTNQMVWVNEVLRKLLCLNDNEISLQEFLSNICPDDLALVQEKRAAVSHIHPQYILSYRYNTGGKWIYIKEMGTRITNGKTVEFCGIIRVVEGQKRVKNDALLDYVLGEPEMLSCINSLYKGERMFQVALLQLDAIDKINQDYGRNFGDMVIAEYIRLVMERYVDDKLIFRISGLEFVLVITDYRKMERLKNDLANGEKYLHMNVQFASEKTKVNARMAICSSSEAKDAKDTLKKAKEALRICSKEQYSLNYAYYKDIR